MGVVHQVTTIGGIALARTIGSKIGSFHCLSILKAHMNLNGIQRLSGLIGRKCLDNKFQVLINI